MWLNGCNVMIKHEHMRTCFLWLSKESGFLRWHLLLVKILWEDCWNDNKYLENDITLVDKLTSRSWDNWLNFERRSVSKMLSNSIPCYRETVRGRVNLCSKLHCCLIWRNCHSHPNLHPPPCGPPSTFRQDALRLSGTTWLALVR